MLRCGRGSDRLAALLSCWCVRACALCSAGALQSRWVEAVCGVFRPEQAQLCECCLRSNVKCRAVHWRLPHAGKLRSEQQLPWSKKPEQRRSPGMKTQWSKCRLVTRGEVERRPTDRHRDEAGIHSITYTSIFGRSNGNNGNLCSQQAAAQTKETTGSMHEHLQRSAGNQSTARCK